MPLPTDPKALALSRELLQDFDTINGGEHRGFRPAHAKGVLLAGIFQPLPEGAALTRAPHAHRQTPVTVRFSNFAGIPHGADNDPQIASAAAAPSGFISASTFTPILWPTPTTAFPPAP